MHDHSDNEYIERYKRHILIKNIGGQGQKKLGKAKVLLVGLGGIGSTVLQHLAAAGIGKIGLVDQDTVALSNLQRQTVYTHADIGRKKVSVASNFIRNLNKNVDVFEYDFFLKPNNSTKIIGEYDVVLDGSDVTYSRIEEILVANWKIKAWFCPLHDGMPWPEKYWRKAYEIGVDLPIYEVDMSGNRLGEIDLEKYFGEDPGDLELVDEDPRQSDIVRSALGRM